MNLLALKMLLGDKLKYLGLVIGLAFAALLVTQQASIFNGFMHRTGAWINDTGPVDLWVMDPQVEFSDDFKPMNNTALLRVRSVEGVAWAVPMYKSFLKMTLPDGTQMNTRIVGLDDATLLGGPPKMVEGEMTALRNDRAIIINQKDLKKSLILKHTTPERSLQVGDRVSINDNELEIVGVYTKSEEFFWEPLIYTTYSRALAIAPPERKVTSFVLVGIQPGYTPAQVSANIKASTGLLARTPDQFVDASINYILNKTGILVNFGITIALGFIIGALVSGGLLYNFVLDNLRHFAALKAMGLSDWRIIRMVLLQTLFVGTVGYGIGLGLSCLSAILLKKGGLAFFMSWHIPVGAAVAIMFCCLVAAMISIWRVLRLEPAVVFKG